MILLLLHLPMTLRCPTIKCLTSAVYSVLSRFIIKSMEKPYYYVQRFFKHIHHNASLTCDYQRDQVTLQHQLYLFSGNTSNHLVPLSHFDLLFPQLMTQQETAGLGVVLLQTTSEEMANPREDLSISRKHELKQLLLEMMPRILAALCSKFKITLYQCLTH